MSHGSEDSGLHRHRRRRRGAGNGSTNAISSTDTNSLIGFWSFDAFDGEEFSLRAAVERDGDLAWSRLNLELGTELITSAKSEISALQPAAMIVVLGTADTAVVGPLFAGLRFGNPERPI